MINNGPIIGEKIILRMITEQDCNQKYLEWMTDFETNRYMETRWQEHSYETIKAYVNSIKESEHSLMLAIIDKNSGTHIGNIKIGPVNYRYKYADISYFIGDKSFRGKGYAAEAVRCICEYGFNELKLHRIQAGIIEGNDKSANLLLACGFELEGRMKDKFIVNGEYKDHLIFGRLS